MAAYVLINITITDPERYADYAKLAPGTVAQYGGRYLARGGSAETLEGTTPAGRVVVIEFPSSDQARAWLNSPEYAGPKAIRHSASTSIMWVVEGFVPAPSA
ncbi:MAG: DUF1330 domain-containing protein [Vicinamibacterales bacterium]|nr:DUF1330 domain-containing protein [Vicinamibacterales bacterium]